MSLSQVFTTLQLLFTLNFYYTLFRITQQVLWPPRLPTSIILSRSRGFSTNAFDHVKPPERTVRSMKTRRPREPCSYRPQMRLPDDFDDSDDDSGPPRSTPKSTTHDDSVSESHAQSSDDFARQPRDSPSCPYAADLRHQSLRSDPGPPIQQAVLERNLDFSQETAKSSASAGYLNLFATSSTTQKMIKQPKVTNNVTIACFFQIRGTTSNNPQPSLSAGPREESNPESSRRVRTGTARIGNQVVLNQPITSAQETQSQNVHGHETSRLTSFRSAVGETASSSRVSRKRRIDSDPTEESRSFGRMYSWVYRNPSTSDGHHNSANDSPMEVEPTSSMYCHADDPEEMCIEWRRDENMSPERWRFADQERPQGSRCFLEGETQYFDSDVRMQESEEAAYFSSQPTVENSEEIPNMHGTRQVPQDFLELQVILNALCLAALQIIRRGLNIEGSSVNTRTRDPQFPQSLQQFFDTRDLCNAVFRNCVPPEGNHDVTVSAVFKYVPEYSIPKRNVHSFSLRVTFENTSLTQDYRIYKYNISVQMRAGQRAEISGDGTCGKPSMIPAQGRVIHEFIVTIAGHLSEPTPTIGKVHALFAARKTQHPIQGPLLLLDPGVVNFEVKGQPQLPSNVQIRDSLRYPALQTYRARTTSLPRCPPEVRIFSDDEYVKNFVDDLCSPIGSDSDIDRLGSMLSYMTILCS